MSDDFLRSLLPPRPFHQCFGDLPSDDGGAAIIMCDEREDGTLWAGNLEYSSQVPFCPYCGFRAIEAPIDPAGGNFR